MHITLITPAKKQARNGNRISALRWAKFLRQDNHTVKIHTEYNYSKTNLMIALHAWRSSNAIIKYKKLYPKGPLIVVLGGTDVNKFLEIDKDLTLKSLELANAIVCLHGLVGDLLPKHLHRKLHLIRQSATPLPKIRRPSKKFFDVCVIGHLRDEKDALRAALAARLVPQKSKIRVNLFGKAYSDHWAKKAQNEMINNKRFRWYGEVPKWRIRQEYAKTNLMVISSTQEGGANVISEAIIANVPVIASKISGNVGLLGPQYPAYYPQKNEHALAKIIVKAETNLNFLDSILHYYQSIKKFYLPEKEHKDWLLLVNKVMAAK